MSTVQTSTRVRVAAITGASRGLGAGMAQFFLDRGMRIAVCARTLPPFENDGRSMARAVDVTDHAAVTSFCAEAVERFDQIDLWINNAGILTPMGPLRDNDPADFTRHIEVNVLGTFHGSQAFIRHLHERGGEGTLINMSSGAARNAYAGWSAYCSGKAAVDRMSQAIALEESQYGLRVHAVSPGVIDTDMQDIIRNSHPAIFPKVHKFVELKNNNQLSTPEFVAEHILKLCFDPVHRTEDVLVSLPRPQP
ncbi:MAG: SDR family oxidoreductase [Thiohalocapsa sp.]